MPMESIAQLTTKIVPGLDLKKIKRTDETPPRVSIHDLIAAISTKCQPLGHAGKASGGCYRK